jgi:hypothetical protein
MDGDVEFLKDKLEDVLNRLEPQRFEAMVYTAKACEKNPMEPKVANPGEMLSKDDMLANIFSEVDYDDSVLLAMVLGYAGLKNFNIDCLDNGSDIGNAEGRRNVEWIIRRACLRISPIVKKNRGLLGRYEDFVRKETLKRVGSKQKPASAYLLDSLRLGFGNETQSYYTTTLSEVDSELLGLGGVLGW